MSEVPRFWRLQRESIGRMVFDPDSGEYNWINKYSRLKNGHENGNGRAEIYNFESDATTLPERGESVNPHRIIYHTTLLDKEAAK